MLAPHRVPFDQVKHRFISWCIFFTIRNKLARRLGDPMAELVEASVKSPVQEKVKSKFSEREVCFLL